MMIDSQEHFEQRFPGYVIAVDSVGACIYINKTFCDWIDSNNVVDGAKENNTNQLDYTEKLQLLSKKMVNTSATNQSGPNSIEFFSKEGYLVVNFVKLGKDDDNYDYFVSSNEFISEKRNRTCEVTGLNNKFSFVEHMQASVNSNEHLIYINLDEFKYVNDLYGHVEGNLVLKKFGDLIDNSFRYEDFIARLGKDEFVILCDSKLSMESILMRMKDINKKFHNAYKDSYPRLGWSWGIAKNDASNYQVTVAKAMSQMQEQKNRKRSLLKIY